MMMRKKHDPCRAARSPLGGSMLSLRDCTDKEADPLLCVSPKIRGPLGPSSTGLFGHYSTGHLLKLMTRTCTIASDMARPDTHIK